MAYNIDPYKVHSNRELLDLITKNLELGQDTTLELDGQTAPRTAAYQIYEILASARAYPQRQSDRELKDSCRVTVEYDPLRIVIHPRGKARSGLRLGAPRGAGQALIKLATSTSDTLNRFEWIPEGDSEHDLKVDVATFYESASAHGWSITFLEQFEKFGELMVACRCERRPQGGPADVWDRVLGPYSAPPSAGLPDEPAEGGDSSALGEAE